jgi:hypothetical protein
MVIVNLSLELLADLLRLRDGMRITFVEQGLNERINGTAILAISGDELPKVAEGGPPIGVGLETLQQITSRRSQQR